MEIINLFQTNARNSSRCSTDALAPPHTGDGSCSNNCSCIGNVDGQPGCVSCFECFFF